MNYTTAYLYNAPLCTDGSYTMDFNGISKKGWFDANCAVATYENCYYVRKDEVLTVGENADVLDSLGVNYVCYQNDGGTQIFAFVTKIEYKAEKTTVLHLKTDSFITYQDKIIRTEAFIEREHVYDDTRGLNLLPEPVAITNYDKNYVIERFYSAVNSNDFASTYCIGIVIGSLNYDDTDFNKEAKKGINDALHFSGGTPIGGNMFAVEWGDGGSIFAACIRCLTILNADIVCAFPIPWDFIQSRTQTKNITFEEDGSSITFEIFLPLPSNKTATIDYTTSPWGVAPRHRKLYSYPYNFFVGTNECGTSQIYRAEKFGNNVFNIRYTIAPAPSLALYPDYYNGIFNDMNAIVTNANVPTIPWSSNAYDQFFARNTNTLIFNQVSRTADYVAGLFTLDAETMIDESISMGMDVARKEAQYNDLKSLGNSVHGIPSSSLCNVIGKYGVGVYQQFVSDDEKERIDQFFDRFGYNVSKTAEIQWDSRPHYNYVKTQNANISGQIPQQDKANINALLNAGLTVWHMGNGASYGVFDSNNYAPIR